MYSFLEALDGIVSIEWACVVDGDDADVAFICSILFIAEVQSIALEHVCYAAFSAALRNKEPYSLEKTSVDS